MKQAVILAAGEGKRLRPFTTSKPKAMLSIAGKPILQYTIEALAEKGIRNILLVVGYKKEQIFDYIGSGEALNVDINYAEQPKQLGTANALMQVKSLVDDEFLVLPGDKLIDKETISEFISVKPMAMLTKKIENPPRKLVVLVEDGVIKKAKLNERRSVSSEREPGVFTINTGIYSFNRKIFEYINDEQFLPDVLSNMINNGEVINTLETKGTWLDVSYPWDIIRLNASVLSNIKECISCTVKNNVSIRGNVSLGENTVIRSNSYLKGPVVIGCGCDIGPNVCILPSTSIGDNVCISPFTEIRNSVIGNDVIIGSGSIIQDSVIDRGCIIKGTFAAISDEAEIKIDDEYHNVNTGAMLGEGCRLGSHIVARPGVIVGRNSQIKAMNTISGNLPDKSIVI